MTQFSAADIKPHLSLAADDAGQDGLISDYIASAEAVTPDPARELPFGVMMMLAPHRDLGA